MIHPALQDAQTVAVPGAQTYTFQSAVTGRAYRIFVAVPDAPAPEGGFPVLYLLDGDLHFPPAAHYARFGALGGELRAAVIVGIGYTGEPAEAMLARFTELSLPASAAWIAGLAFTIPGLVAENTGGIDGFLAMIETELKPAIATLGSIDAANQSLFGHSLGGLAVLRALFTAPAAYRTFIASSPSIWWADCAILAGEAGLAAALSGSNARPRVLITAGANEAAPEPSALRFFKTRAEAEASTARSRMVANATELGDRLQALGLADVHTTVFADEGHGSVTPAVLGRALTLALAVDTCA